MHETSKIVQWEKKFKTKIKGRGNKWTRVKSLTFAKQRRANESESRQKGKLLRRIEER